MDIVAFIRAAAALALTLGLIGLAAALVRKFGPDWMERFRQAQGGRRLTLIETLPLDPDRRLVLVRMDDEERLILLGEGQLLAVRPAASPPPASEMSA